MVSKTGEDVTFSGVQEIVQGDTNFYAFVINGADLLEIAVVKRHGDHVHGVQRHLRKAQVRKYAQDLVGGALFADAIITNLAGDWAYGTGQLMGERNPKRGKLAELEILDGQHRVAALELIRDEHGIEMVRKFNFSVVAVMRASDRQRAEIFLGQAARLGMDRNLAGALTHQLGQYRSDTERHTYGALTRLNMDPNSPVRDMIVFGDSVTAEGKKVKATGRYPARSLYTNLLSVFSERKTSTCLLKQYTPKEREQIVLNAFIAMSRANRLFAHEGTSGATLLAITTLLAFLSSHRNVLMRMITESPNATNPELTFSVEAFERVFSYSRRFQWAARERAQDRKRPNSPHEVAQRLDNYIATRWARGVVKEEEV